MTKFWTTYDHRWVIDMALTVHSVKRYKTVVARSQSVHPPAPPEPKQVCRHRTEQIGYVDCGCAGARAAYQCNVLVRPDREPPEPAYCVDRLPVKRTRIIGLDGVTQLAVLRYEELVECGRKCDMYDPIAVVSRSGVDEFDRPA